MRKSLIKGPIFGEDLNSEFAGSKLYILLQNLKHIFWRNSFSETGEDAIISQFFPEFSGSYLDIGAGNPVIGSNSFYLYRRGFFGICVDPIPNMNLAWKVLRLKDKFISKAVSAQEESSITFYSFRNSLLSTTENLIAEFHSKKGKGYKTIQVETVKMAEIMPHRLESSEPFLLSLDVEGSEFELLKQIDFQRQRPRVILVESWSIPWENSPPFANLLKTAKYRLVGYTGLTCVYLAMEIEEKYFQNRWQLSNVNQSLKAE